MSKSTSRNLYLAAVAIEIIGVILFILSLRGGTATPTSTGTSITPGSPLLFGFAIFLFFAGGIVSLVAWIGALIKMAKLGQWVWFILLLVASGITMLVYIFAGPTTPSSAKMNPAPYPPNPSYPQR